MGVSFVSVSWALACCSWALPGYFEIGAEYEYSDGKEITDVIIN